MDPWQLYPLNLDVRQGYAFIGALAALARDVPRRFQTASRQLYAFNDGKIIVYSTLAEARDSLLETNQAPAPRLNAAWSFHSGTRAGTIPKVTHQPRLSCNNPMGC